MSIAQAGQGVRSILTAYSIQYTQFRNQKVMLLFYFYLFAILLSSFNFPFFFDEYNVLEITRQILIKVQVQVYVRLGVLHRVGLGIGYLNWHHFTMKRQKINLQHFSCLGTSQSHLILQLSKPSLVATATILFARAILLARATKNSLKF